MKIDSTRVIRQRGEIVAYIKHVDDRYQPWQVRDTHQNILYESSFLWQCQDYAKQKFY